MSLVQMLSTTSETTPPDGRPLRGCSVVVVEDDVDTLDFLSLLLRKLGAAVNVAVNADVAPGVVAASRPDVILCDLGLPGQDGYALLRTLDASGAIRPVIAISGHHSPTQRQRALAAGFAAYLPKPSKLAEIVATIMDVLDDAPAAIA